MHSVTISHHYRLIWKKYSHVWLIDQIGQEEFDIPVNVIDMVYTQTLCWIGAFYSPLLPFITLFKILVFFFVKKVSHTFGWLKCLLLPLVYNAMDLYMNCDLNLGEKCMVEGLSGMDGFSMCYCMPWPLLFFMIIPLFYFSCRFSAIKSRLQLHTGLPV